MKCKGIFLGITVFAAGLCFAEIDGSPYMRVSGGLSMPTDSTFSSDDFSEDVAFADGTFFALALGTEMVTVPGRVEVELSHQKNDSDNSASDSYSEGCTIMSLMLNSYYDVRNESIFTPYVMAGVGLSKVDATVFGIGKNELVVGFQLGAGLGIKLSDHFSIDAEYRYYMTANTQTDSVNLEIAGQRILAGLRYTF